MTADLTLEITYQELLLVKLFTATLPKFFTGKIEDYLFDYQIDKEQILEIGLFLSDYINKNDTVGQDGKVILYLNQRQALMLDSILECAGSMWVERELITEEQSDRLADLSERFGVMLYKLLEERNQQKE